MKKTLKKDKPPSVPRETSFPVVGIGASAGGLGMQKTDKSTIWVSLEAAAARAADGAPTCRVALSDISGRKHLEKIQAHIDDLELFNKMAVGRELRMIELKHEVNKLCRLLGKDQPYMLD